MDGDRAIIFICWFLWQDFSLDTRITLLPYSSVSQTHLILFVKKITINQYLRLIALEQIDFAPALIILNEENLTKIQIEWDIS